MVLQDLHPSGCRHFLSLLISWAENALAFKFAYFGFLKIYFGFFSPSMQVLSIWVA